MMKKCWWIMILLLMVSPMSGCRMKLVKVCGTNYPVTYLIERIGQNYVEACNLSSDDAIQVATVSDTFLRDLDEAEVIFTISSLEPYYPIYNEEFTKNSSKIIDLAHTSAIYKFERYTTTTVNNQELVIEGPYYEGSMFESIDTYDKDVILWMDPISMMSMAKTVAKTLSDLYPENTKDFMKRYDELEVELAMMDAEFQNIRRNSNRISFVSVTPSFGNWQKSYGFSVYPLILSKYGALPTDAQLEEICEQIKNAGVKYIAHEENLNEDMEALFKKVQEKCNLTRIELNNISSISEEQMKNNKNYMSLMYENISSLEALK